MKIYSRHLSAFIFHLETESRELLVKSLRKNTCFSGMCLWVFTSSVSRVEGSEKKNIHESRSGKVVSSEMVITINVVDPQQSLKKDFSL